MSGPLTPPNRSQQPNLAMQALPGPVAIDRPQPAPATTSAAPAILATNDATLQRAQLGLPLPLPLPHAASAQQLQAALTQLADSSEPGFDLQTAIVAAALPGLLAADALSAARSGSLKPVCFALGAQALVAAQAGGDAPRAAAAEAIQQLLLLGSLVSGAEAARSQPRAF
jgi:hypothetical protein